METRNALTSFLIGFDAMRRRRIAAAVHPKGARLVFGEALPDLRRTLPAKLQDF